MDHDALSETRLRLQPTPREARWLIVVLVAGSAAPAIAGFDVHGAVVIAAILASMVAWYGLVFHVAGREREPSINVWARACIRTLDPRWYADVVRTSRWNPKLAGTAVIAATVFTLYELVT